MNAAADAITTGQRQPARARTLPERLAMTAVTWATWVAIFAPLPYSLSRILWAVGVPLGVDAHHLHDDIGAPGAGSVWLLTLALLSEATAVFVHVIVHRRARRVPVWVPLIGGRPVDPRFVVGLLCLPLAILWVANAQSIWFAINGIPAASLAGVPAWSTWAMVAIFWVWSLALTIVTVDYARSPTFARRRG